jgi:hypothetical protein
LYERAIHDVLEILDVLALTYWVTEGTLIELLRFGRNHPPESGRYVDHDVDAMIELDRLDDWLPVAAQIATMLSRRGWIPEPLLSTASNSGARRDWLRCWLRGRRWTVTRCDLHSYVADRASGIAWVHEDGVGYPFQRWGGAVPLDLIHPMGRCLCYERTAPAPCRPVDLLRDWNDGEYERPCLALPRRRATARETALIVDYSRRLDALGVQSFTSELRRAGLVGGS